MARSACGASSAGRGQGGAGKRVGAPRTQPTKKKEKKSAKKKSGPGIRCDLCCAKAKDALCPMLVGISLSTSTILFDECFVGGGSCFIIAS
jgi:hypothetical protein